MNSKIRKISTALLLVSFFSTMFIGESYILDIEGDGSVVLQEKYFFKDAPVSNDDTNSPVDNHIAVSRFNAPIKPPPFIGNIHVAPALTIDLVVPPYVQPKLLDNYFLRLSTTNFPLTFYTESLRSISTTVLLI